MNNLKKWLPLIVLGLPLLLLPFDWYNNMRRDADTIIIQNASGLYAFQQEHGRIAIIYLLCMIVEVLAYRNKEWAFAIVSKILLVGVLICYPMLATTVGGFASNALYFYGIGFYIAVSLIFIAILLNVYQLIKKTNTKN